MTTPTARSRLLSEADCQDIVRRLGRFASGGGFTDVRIVSRWLGDVRWARNQIHAGKEVTDNEILVYRNLNGATGEVVINDTSDAALIAATRRAERIARLDMERPHTDLAVRLPLEPTTTPHLFSEATYQLDADGRSMAAVALAEQAASVGMMSAGYIQVAAVSIAFIDTLGRARYFPWTQAQYSVTVRDPKGTGSGWAGASEYDWQKIDAVKLTTVALDKCLKSQNPVRVEPGRYTTILEPQAVADFVGLLFRGQLSTAIQVAIGRQSAESDGSNAGPFVKSLAKNGAIPYSLLGEKVVDERITISADPTDPECGFPPFWGYGYGRSGPDRQDIDVYHPVTWIERGVLKNLAYERDFGISSLGQGTGLPNSGAFRMSGGETTIEEMIATTKRGLLVTRFHQPFEIHFRSALYRGYTRDGLWLIESGKISKPAKNLVFTESILFALNNVEQLGVPQHTYIQTALGYMMPQPALVPPLKIRDFSFTALSDAV